MIQANSDLLGSGSVGMQATVVALPNKVIFEILSEDFFSAE